MGLTRDHISEPWLLRCADLPIAKFQEGKFLARICFGIRLADGHGQGLGEIKRLPKTQDLTVDLDELYNAITDDVAMVQVCNPNNPTAIMSDPDELRAFCIKASKKCTVPGG